MVLGAVVLWEIGVRVLHIRPFILPAPSLVLIRIADHPRLFLTSSLYTLQEIVIGLGAAILVGVLLGVLIASWPPLSRIVYPLLVSSQTIPKVALAPLLVIWFGFGLMPKILITFLIAFFPVIVDTAGGLAAVDPELVRLARVMRGSAWRVFWKVRLPSALPQMFAGFKVAATLAVVGAVVGEFVGADNGLGWLLIQANGQADTSLAFAAILVMAVIGTLLFQLVVTVERWAIPWHLATAEGDER